MTKTEHFKTILAALMVAAVAIGIAVIITLAIMHATGIRAGYVYSKRFEAGYTTHSKTCDKNSSGDVVSCEYTDRTYPDQYKLFYKDGDHTNWSDVPEKIWYSVSVGQWFDGDCMCVIPK